MTDWQLSRRALLRRLGVGLGCLPLLSATRSYAATPTWPRRFLCLVQPQGYRVGRWLPKEGPLQGTPLPDSASPLEPYKDDLIFLGNMTNPAFAGCRSCGHEAYGPLFTGASGRKGEGDAFEATSASIDQVIAARFARELAVPSLALGVQVDARPAAPRGARRCFWQAENRPVDPEGDPIKTAARLFGGSAVSDPSYARLVREKKSILDYVARELGRYQRRLGTEDRALVEAHQTSMRDLELKLSGVAPAAASVACRSPVPIGPTPNPAVDPAELPAFLRLQLNLMVAAVRCDLTRVVTLQIGDAHGSGFTFGFVPGVPAPRPGAPARDWEAMSHSPVAGGVDDKALVDKWLMAELAGLLGFLKQTPEGGGTLLDQCAVLLATPMEDGATHDAQKLSWLLAGRCGGYFKTGQAAASAGKPINGVLTEIGRAMGLPLDSFGDKALGAPLPGLRA